MDRQQGNAKMQESDPAMLACMGLQRALCAALPFSEGKLLWA
jgi:hypothetical protein